MFVPFLWACNKNDDWTNPLNEQEQLTLKLSVEKINSEFFPDFYTKMVELGEQSYPISAAHVMQKLPIYMEIRDDFQDDLEKLPFLIHFIIYDKRNIDGIKPLSSALLWDIAETNYPSVVSDLREQNKLTDVELIKALLPYFKM